MLYEMRLGPYERAREAQRAARAICDASLGAPAARRGRSREPMEAAVSSQLRSVLRASARRSPLRGRPAAGSSKKRAPSRPDRRRSPTSCSSSARAPRASCSARSAGSSASRCAQTLAPEEIDAELATRVPIAFAKKHQLLLPIKRDGDGDVRVAIADPARHRPARRPAHDLRRRALEPVLGSRRAILNCINHVYDPASAPPRTSPTSSTTDLAASPRELIAGARGPARARPTRARRSSGW